MSGILDDAALDELRTLVRGGMTASCAVQAFTRVHQGGGVYTETWATITGREAHPCSVAPAAAPNEIVAADAVQAVARYTVKFEHDVAPILDTHRLVITPDPVESPGMPVLTMAVIGTGYKTTAISRRVLAEVVS